MFDIQTSPFHTALPHDICPQRGPGRAPRRCPPYQDQGQVWVRVCLGWAGGRAAGAGRSVGKGRRAAEAQEIPAAHIQTFRTQTGPVPPTGQVPHWIVGNGERRTGGVDQREER